ncbi:hypothetical protein SKAU_G00224380 [Synaphobranchus kaupii]|uniref:Myb/SANT-like DNA-binding domain-containing protein n=1 Tax=Synaphobranchus kaupii TaxID=118154 RepID=A0A9Q1IW64_SYNKA|nr:hypothetical protein SKAU_G00224380 [Synaphobranchus kaupii]
MRPWRRQHPYPLPHNPPEHSYSLTRNHPRVFVRHPCNRPQQHQHHHGGQGGNSHQTLYVPRPLLPPQVPLPPDLHNQGYSVQHMPVPWTAPSQLPSNSPLLLQQSNDLSHQPGNIYHPPASLGQRLDHPPNQLANISHQLAHLPNWLTRISHQQAGFPQWFTHRTHDRSHRFLQPAHVTDEPDRNLMQGQIPGYQQTTSTHSPNTSSMRQMRLEQPGPGPPVSREQGVAGAARDRNQDMRSMVEQLRERGHRGLSRDSIRYLPSHRFRSDSQTAEQTQRRLREAAAQLLGHHFEWHMESNYPVITNVFDTDWCNHLWGDANSTSARHKSVTMESQHHLQQGGSEPAYVSFKNEPEHRDLLMQEVHIPSEMPVVGNSSVYPLQPGGLQNSSKNAVNQRDLQALHFHANSDSRKSRARFTREEERALLAGVVDRWDELYGYQSQALPRGAKSRIWNDIAARLSSSSREVREGEDVRKKWLYTKLTLRNRLRAASQLGLGTYPPDLTPLEQRVLALMGHDSGGSVDAPDIGFGPVSGEDFRPLTLHGHEDLETVGSTSDGEMDGNQDEPQEEPAPPLFVPAVSVASPIPGSTTPSTSAPSSASNAQRKNARPEDPLAPALAAIKSRQDRSITLYKEAIAVLRSLAADVRRYVDHMLAPTAPEPVSAPEGVSQGASASKQPAPPTPTSGHASMPQQHVPTWGEHPPGRQPPCATPTCPHPQSGVPFIQTVPQHPACSFPPQYPPMCPYHILPQFPTVAYPAYYSTPQSSMHHFPQHTHPAMAPHIYQYPPAVTIVAPPPVYPAPSPVAPQTVSHRSPQPSFYPAPPSAPVDPGLSTEHCAPFSDCQAAPRTLGPPPPASSHNPYQSTAQRRRERGCIRKRWGRRGGSSSYLSGRSGGFS